MNELLAELLKLIKSDSKKDADDLVSKIKGKVSALDTEVTKKEAQAIKSDKKVLELTATIDAIGGELGVKEDFTGAIAEIKKGKKGDDTVKDKEIAQLKTEIALARDEYSAKFAAKNAEMMEIILEKDVAVLLPKHKAKANATNYIVDSVKKTATVVDGKIVFKNPDGTTLRTSGRDSTLDDIIGSMAEAEKKAGESMFFNTEPQQSGAGGKQGGITSGGDFVV